MAWVSARGVMDFLHEALNAVLPWGKPWEHIACPMHSSGFWNNIYCILTLSDYWLISALMNKYATTSEKSYSCVVKEAITILQQAKVFLSFYCYQKEFLKIWEKCISKKLNKKAAILDQGRTNFRGPGGFEAKDFKTVFKTKKIFEDSTSAREVLQKLSYCSDSL